ncbi:hypothetical protein GCM10009741_71110 [Kribbella lupini]|uniref:Uncharacterized protein n=1 Tax=Kribbella lupini TaxID=291602 RepID=A0ABP4N951_9ACTN
MLVPGIDRLALSEQAKTSRRPPTGDHKGTTSGPATVFPARPVFATSEFVAVAAPEGTLRTACPRKCPQCETTGMRTVPVPVAGTGTVCSHQRDPEAESAGDYFASLYAARTSAEIRPRSLTS